MAHEGPLAALREPSAQGEQGGSEFVLGAPSPTRLRERTGQEEQLPAKLHIFTKSKTIRLLPPKL